MRVATENHCDDQSGRVDSVEKLRTIIKPPAKMVAEKRQSIFEPAGQYLLDRVCGAAFVTAGQGDSFHTSMATGKPGFARILDATTICVSGIDEESVSNLRADAGFGGLFMIPGIDYTVRVNAKFLEASGDAVDLRLDEAYFHCPKAYMRSSLWASNDIQEEASSSTEAAVGLDDEMRSFLALSSFAFLATRGQAGGFDVSPRGDGPGFLRSLEDGRLVLPDRPGNRIADSLINIIESGRLGLLSLVPGSMRALQINAQAELICDEARLAESAVNGKVPKLGIALAPNQLRWIDFEREWAGVMWDETQRTGIEDTVSFGKLLARQGLLGGKRAQGMKGWALDVALRQEAKRTLF